MPTVETLLTVMAAGFLLSISPGPSMLYVLSRSVGQSRVAGLASAFGLAIGGVILAIVAAIGLAVVFQQSTLAYQVVTIVGGLYVAYLGLQTIVSQSSQGSSDLDEPEDVREEKVMNIIYQGVLVEVLNPKTILFFIAFIPQFVDSSRSDITLQLVVLGVLVPLTAIPSDLFIALAGGTLAQSIKRSSVGSSVLNWIAGLTLIAIGMSILAQ